MLKICENTGCKNVYDARGRAKYCPSCRPSVNARRGRGWKRDRMEDPGYREEVNAGKRGGKQYANAEYMREYRKDNPGYVEQNREQTRERSAKKREQDNE